MRTKLETRIENQRARNAELVRLFKSKGADIEEPRRIDCHLWAPSEEIANHLASQLQKLGFEMLRLNRSTDGRWNLELCIMQSVRVTASEDFTREIVTKADDWSSVYDGWGTSLP